MSEIQGLLSLPSPAEAARARDEALVRVAQDPQDSWNTRALDLIPGYLETPEFTGEQLRIWVCSKIGYPHHHNATGAMVRCAITRGLIVATGRYTKMSTRQSHARATPVYRMGAEKVASRP